MFRLLKNIAALAVTAVLLTAIAGNISAAELFVSIDGSDDVGDGTSGNPYATIPVAINNMVNYGDTITVMPGDYNHIYIYLENGAYIRSQYGPDSVSFDAGDSAAIFVFSDASSDCAIDGFTLKNGQRAIRAHYSSNIIIKNNVFTDCYEDSAGAAVYLYSCTGDIYDNIFSGNSSYEAGGAFISVYCDILLYNNVFENNNVVITYGRGGGASINFYYGEIGNNVIQNNIFVDNQASLGAGLFIAGNYSHVYNNLFLQNSAAEYGGGLYVEYGYDPWIANNIFMQNSPDGMYCSSTYLTYYDYNDYYGNSPTNGCLGCPAPDNDLTLNPYFVDLAGGDYHLSDSSGLINQGQLDIEELLSIDFDDQNRILAGLIDIGPDEFADCDMSGDFAAVGDTAGCPEFAVEFNALDLDGFYDSLVWDFGDGYFAYNDLNPQHVYYDTGSFAVSLSMITPCTAVVISKEDYIRIMDEPYAQFQAANVSGCMPFEAVFENQTVGMFDSCLWDFGDETTSYDTDPVHTYDIAGTYTVTLTAYNLCGTNSLQKAEYIEVLSGAIADFTAAPLSGSAPLQVQFTDQSLNDPATWDWDFGDGAIDVIQNPENRYIFPGIYDVSLICANGCAELPDTLIRSDYVTIYGFEAVVYNTQQTSKYITRYNFYLDSLYGLFDRSVSFKAVMPVKPSRGIVTNYFLDSTTVLFDSTYLQTTITKDVPRGTYDFLLISTGSNSAPVDTQVLEFTSQADSLIETTPLALDFGEVPQDSTKHMTLTVRTNIVFPDTFSLSITDITTSGEPFAVDTPSAFILDIINKNRAVPVAFTPTGLGDYTGSLTIFSNDPAYPEWSINLSGTGILERTPPVVDSSAPDKDEKEFPVTDSIVIVFSEAIDQATLQPGAIVITSLLSGGEITGTGTYYPETSTYVFHPEGGFAISDSISILIKGIVADIVGNTLDGDGDGVGEGTPLDDLVFTFTTGLAAYPGDANNDGIVNEMDVLPLGVYWEVTGDTREGDTQSWSRQAVKRWTPVKATYADCNGDGIVNGDDLTVIQNNWGLTHAIEGTPTVFSLDDLNNNADNFGLVNHILNENGMDENGVKIHDVIAAYISEDGDVESFSLGRNFPNPFNPVTTIDYNIPRECHVTLEVYNVLGQTVKMLVDEGQGAGFHSVTWDGTDDKGNPVPSGVYFYRMTADDFNKVRKMLLIR